MGGPGCERSAHRPRAAFPEAHSMGSTIGDTSSAITGHGTIITTTGLGKRALMAIVAAVAFTAVVLCVLSPTGGETALQSRGVPEGFPQRASGVTIERAASRALGSDLDAFLQRRSTQRGPIDTMAPPLGLLEGKLSAQGLKQYDDTITQTTGYNPFPAKTKGELDPAFNDIAIKKRGMAGEAEVTEMTKKVFQHLESADRHYAQSQSSQPKKDSHGLTQHEKDLAMGVGSSPIDPLLTDQMEEALGGGTGGAAHHASTTASDLKKAHMGDGDQIAKQQPTGAATTEEADDGSIAAWGQGQHAKHGPHGSVHQSSATTVWSNDDADEDENGDLDEGEKEVEATTKAEEALAGADAARGGEHYNVDPIQQTTGFNPFPGAKENKPFPGATDVKDPAFRHPAGMISTSEKGLASQGGGRKPTLSPTQGGLEHTDSSAGGQEDGDEDGDGDADGDEHSDDSSDDDAGDEDDSSDSDGSNGGNTDNSGNDGSDNSASDGGRDLQDPVEHTFHQNPFPGAPEKDPAFHQFAGAHGHIGMTQTGGRPAGKAKSGAVASESAVALARKAMEAHEAARHAENKMAGLQAETAKKEAAYKQAVKSEQLMR